MPILPLLLRNGGFTAEDMTVLVAAFDDALRELRLFDRKDPAAALVANRIIKVAKQGERDPDLLRDAVLKSFREDAGFSGYLPRAFLNYPQRSGARWAAALDPTLNPSGTAGRAALRQCPQSAACRRAQR